MISRIVHNFFRIRANLKYWWRERFTIPGRLVWAIIIFSAMVGVDTNRTTAFQVFCFFCVVMLFSWVFSKFFSCSIQAERRLPKFGTVGQPFHYAIQLNNQGKRRERGLGCMEIMQDDRLSLDQLKKADWPKGLWARLVRLGESSRRSYPRGVVSPVPDMGPGASTEIEASVTPASRGRLGFLDVAIVRPDPFNLINSFKRVSRKQSALILPRRYELPPIHLPSVRKRQPGGFSIAHSVGDSEEFLSMRDYQPGDPLRRIHWRSWAKTGKPIIKEFQEEFFVRHALVLDTFPEGRSSRIFEEAVSTAASFASSVQTKESLLDLMFVGAKAYCFTTGRGMGHESLMLEVLASVTPSEGKPFSVLPPAVLQRASALSGVICVLLAWDDERRNFVRELKARSIPVLVLVITDKAADQDEGGGECRYIHVDSMAEDLAKL
ncbi:DUF58 domain-containing protein [Desulfatibacillum aliphaticivorans]|uniref:DUF58 domain-containing protein n=1 Tax=Desulfatibacillum aliphaticivorans TaxID=218208 RepID=UPI00041A7A0B|nr:DUF58 domain-containing protein [Desulfatibacillum aliphaticivorans]